MPYIDIDPIDPAPTSSLEPSEWGPRILRLNVDYDTITLQEEFPPRDPMVGRVGYSTPSESPFQDRYICVFILLQ